MGDDNTKTDENREVAKAEFSATRRRISPYDLSPSNNPGCVISQPTVQGLNYDEWSANVRLALMARKKLGFIDGTIPKPAADCEDLEDWRCNNALVVSWIRLTVDAQLRSSLLTFEVGEDLWNHIAKRFSMKSGAKIGRVKADLAMARQNGRTVESYFGHINQLWTTLGNFRRPNTCECGSCTCNFEAKIAKEKEEDQVHEFLRGLDEIYSNIKSAMMSRVPFPTLDEAYLAVTQEEDSKMEHLTCETSTGEMSFATQAVTRSGHKNDRGRYGCKTCGKTGHTSDACYKNIGYSE